MSAALEFESPEWNAVATFCQAAVDKFYSSGMESLDEDELRAFCVWVGDGEVGNGGLHAVCYNSTGDLLPELSSAFRDIGAVRKAAIFDALANVFGPAGPSIDRRERIDQHEALSETQIALIGDLEEQYFADVDDAIALLFGYLEARGRLAAKRH